jgi:hypothetical protein
MSDRSQRIVHERYIAMFQAIRIVQVVSGEGIHRTGMSVEYLNAGLRNARAFKRSPPMGFGYVKYCPHGLAITIHRRGSTSTGSTSALRYTLPVF